ncbi:MAG TPA: hypothetical protein VGM87_02750 [Roseomonas sp.]|jgi:hypothetical protein
MTLRRFLVFGLLGPPLGFVVGFWGLVPALNWAMDGRSGFDWHQMVLLPLAYAMGIVPALLTALVDAAIAQRGWRWRPLWTAAFAFAASFTPLGTLLVAGYLTSPWILLWGLIGAVPGLVCSALSGGPTRR